MPVPDPLATKAKENELTNAWHLLRYFGYGSISALLRACAAVREIRAQNDSHAQDHGTFKTSQLCPRTGIRADCRGGDAQESAKRLRSRCCDICRQ
jgi:hypothetical protein